MNFLLDTNVLSEAMKKDPSPVVLHWLEDNFERCWLSSVGVGEIELGIELLPEGKRRAGLEDALKRLLAGLQGRTVNFDTLVAHRWAKLCAELERRERKTPILGSMIEAIALQWGMAVATRNVGDFVHARTVNPWLATG